MSINKYFDEIVEDCICLLQKKENDKKKHYMRLDYYYEDIKSIETKLIKCLAYKGIKARVLYIADPIDEFNPVLEME